MHGGPIEALLLEPFVEAQLVGHPVHEQHTVEMVHFMLDAAGQEAIGLELLGPAVLIAEAHLHHRRTHHIEVHPWDAQAALLVGVDRRAEVRYDEGLAVGYRHDAPVAYPFGFGLSYTQFRHSRLRVDRTADDGSVRVSATVTNTGRSPGREVVQVYVSPPSGVGAGVWRPDRELRAFTKTPTLAPGQSMAIELQLSLRDFALFDETQRAWVVPAGIYAVSLGSSVTDIRATARVEFPQTLTVEKVSERL